jgi:glycosyltransferase involved in cell wall biosynthesis
MRVLHVYSGNLWGGVETSLVTLARYRNLNPSMEPHFALVFKGRLSEDLRMSGARVCTLSDVRLSRPTTVWRARRKLADLLKVESFDCVICHSPWPHVIFAPVIRSAGTPLGFWLHDVLGGRHWITSWAARTKPDFAICNSEFTRERLPKLFPAVPGVVIYNPVGESTCSWTEEDLAAARSRLNCPEGAVAIIQPGRIEDWKGHLLHLEALALLKEVSGWVCWIVGAPQGPRQERYYQKLQDRSRELGISDRVQFPGWVHGRDLQVLLAAAQIQCQPNTGAEALGLTFLEAMAAGLPVITTAMGGAAEVVNESCGIVTPPANAEALAEGLRRLISDPALRRKLGAAGPARVRELCDPQQQLTKIQRAIEQHISPSATRRTCTPAR